MHQTRRHHQKSHGCPTGKKRFRDHRAAVSFLHHAAKARAASQQEGATTKLRVVRSYECPLCRGFHVTSQALAA